MLAGFHVFITYALLSDTRELLENGLATGFTVLCLIGVLPALLEARGGAQVFAQQRMRVQEGEAE